MGSVRVRDDGGRKEGKNRRTWRRANGESITDEYIGRSEVVFNKVDSKIDRLNRANIFTFAAVIFLIGEFGFVRPFVDLSFGKLGTRSDIKRDPGCTLRRRHLVHRTQLYTLIMEKYHQHQIRLFSSIVVQWEMQL